MSLKYGLLGFLNYGDMTGYELDKAFKVSLNFFWRAQTSQVYRELKNMEKSEWLSSTRIQQTDKPNKRIYSITDIGKEKLTEWLEQSNGYEDISVKSSFLIRMFFSGEKTTEQNKQALVEYVENCERALAALDQTDSSIEHYSTEIEDKEKAFYWKSTAIYGYYYYEMCIKWGKEMIKRLEEIK